GLVRKIRVRRQGDQAAEQRRVSGDDSKHNTASQRADHGRNGLDEQSSKCWLTVEGCPVTYVHRHSTAVSRCAWLLAAVPKKRGEYRSRAPPVQLSGSYFRPALQKFCINECEPARPAAHRASYSESPAAPCPWPRG